jgi:hypothetical protein
MKRLVLVTVLLLSGGIAAHADTSTYISKIPRSDADLQAAGDYCDRRLALLWQIIAIDQRNWIPESDFQ